MGLYLLNISVDPIDPRPEYMPEDLSINDQESIVEIVIEEVLGYQNAIDEYDDHDTAGHSKKNNAPTGLLLYLTHDHKAAPVCMPIQKQRFPELKVQLANGFHQPDTPPPKG